MKHGTFANCWLCSLMRCGYNRKTATNMPFFFSSFISSTMLPVFIGVAERAIVYWCRIRFAHFIAQFNLMQNMQKKSTHDVAQASAASRTDISVFFSSVFNRPFTSWYYTFIICFHAVYITKCWNRTHNALVVVVAAVHMPIFVCIICISLCRLQYIAIIIMIYSYARMPLIVI